MDSIINLTVQIRNYLVFKYFDILSSIRLKKIGIDNRGKFIVSIASYPKRDHFLPAVFAALAKQTLKPMKWILVLSKEDYKQGLPKHLIRLEKSGVEILWLKNNPYAVKKLIPVIEQYPKVGIVTLDDDIIYNPSLLKGLMDYILLHGECVVGYVGKAILRKSNLLNFYFRELNPADLNTPEEQVYLTGWGGIYYPPDCLDRRVLNLGAVHKIVPGRGSDIWFWAAAVAKNSRQICLGIPEDYNLGIPIPQNKHTSPKDQPGNEVLMNRFQKTVDYFGIRKKLLQLLPNKT